MTNSESILDKVISSKQALIINEFNPKEIVEILIEPLFQREKEVIILRYGLDLKGKKTLEKIGNQFKITRERVRQIENSALKKIRNSTQLEDSRESIEIIFNQTLETHGGLMSEEMLLDEILLRVGATEENRSYTHFIITQLLNDQFHYLPESLDYHPAWKLPSTSLETFKTIIDLAIEILTEFNQPHPLNIILSHLKKTRAEHPDQEYFSEPILTSFLKVSKKIRPNPFNEWGLAHWNTITLKRISDKVYLILKKEGKPLHFTHIAQKINELNFDNKKANPATIHNELILDDKYTLVGRGIYALKEWGYKPGTVSEVIIDLLKDGNQPLTREEIISQVMKRRLVKRSTIILSLMDKNKFVKTKEGYVLNQ